MVLNRLRELDLDHLCLDLHGADVSRRLVAQQLQDSLTRIRDASEPVAAELHARFIDRREALNGHVRRMHSPRLPSGLSVYQMYGRLLQIPKAATANTRFNGPALACLDEPTLLASRDHLRDAAGLSGFITGEYSSTWSGAAITSAEAVRLALDRARRLADHRWPACEVAMDRLLAQCPLTRPRTIGALRQLIETLSAVEEFLGIHQPHLFACDLGRLFTTLAPARSPLRFVWALMFDANFRAAVQEVRGQRREGHVSASGALETVERAQTLRVQWSGIATADAAIPQAAVGLQEFRESFQAVIQDLEPLIAVFPNRRVDELVCADLGAMLQALARDAVTPTQLLRVHDIEVELARLGVGAILPEIRRRKPEPALWPDLLHHAWLSSCLEDVQLQDPTIAAFHGRSHADVVAEFQQLDRQRLTVAVARVTRAHAQRAIEVRNRFSDQNGIVAREAQKKVRHIPLRQLVAQAPDVLLALRPCWMASPLSVSQLIPGDKAYFDVVIFDEASQVLPEDASDLAPSRRPAVVAGDRRQLPPTTFFAAGEDEEGATRTTPPAVSRVFWTSCRRSWIRHGRSTGTIGAATKR